MLVGFKTIPASTECASAAQRDIMRDALYSTRASLHVVTAKVSWLRNQRGEGA
jgi:hypothetical protein